MDDKRRYGGNLLWIVNGMGHELPLAKVENKPYLRPKREKVGEYPVNKDDPLLKSVTVGMHGRVSL
jgi:hypothetical protein